MFAKWRTFLHKGTWILVLGWGCKKCEMANGIILMTANVQGYAPEPGS